MRTIAGYGEGNDKWAFIASPVTENLNPSTVTGLLGTEISSGVGKVTYMPVYLVMFMESDAPAEDESEYIF